MLVRATLFRNPPDCWDVEPMPYKDIRDFIDRPDLVIKTIASVVHRFGNERTQRGRKEGWRKTTRSEDAQILKAFCKVRKPLGSLTESTDVWKALKPELRGKVRHFRIA